MKEDRANEIMNTVLRIYGFKVEEMDRLQTLIKSSAIVGVELLRRSMGHIPQLPFDSQELYEFLDWAKKEEIFARYGGFETAYDVYIRRDGNARARI